MDLASNRVLIMGIDGFTGNHLSLYLKKIGYDVYGTSLYRNGDKKQICDIRKKDDILSVLDSVKPDFVIHLSGISFPAHKDNVDFYHINTIGAINLLDCLIELNLNPLKIILVSSATVYGNQGVEVLDESLCPEPANHYGASKYTMESLASNYFDRLNIITTRPFNYTGIGQSKNFLIPKIVNHFRENRKVIALGNLNIRREFNDISFVCEVYYKLLNSTKKSETVNICSGRGVKILDIVDMMNLIAGYKIEIEINPQFIRTDEIKSLTGSPQKLNKLIGLTEQIDFEDTLRRMFEA
jgi:nucleoside-diphosphate-sugar epimerase